MTTIKLNPDVVFYHIEKCAGTSLERMFYNYFINIYSDDEIYIPVKNNWKHYNLEQKLFFEENKFKVILSHISFNDKISIFGNHLSITCVRDPIDRIISHYYYFDYNNYKIPLHCFTNDELNKYFYKSAAILMRISGGSLNIHDAINNLKKINIILIFEKLPDDIKKLNNVLNNHYNIDSILNLENINVSSKNVTNHDIKKDKDLLLKNVNAINMLNDEILIYNYILKMNHDDRFSTVIKPQNN
jgi:hypothetical protein